MFGRITGYDEELGLVSVSYHRAVVFGRGTVRIDGILYADIDIVRSPDWFRRDLEYDHVWDDELHWSSSSGGWNCWEVVKMVK